MKWINGTVVEKYLLINLLMDFILFVNTANMDLLQCTMRQYNWETYFEMSLKNSNVTNSIPFNLYTFTHVLFVTFGVIDARNYVFLTKNTHINDKYFHQAEHKFYLLMYRQVPPSQLL